jgi:hypothetical protein
MIHWATPWWVHQGVPDVDAAELGRRFADPSAQQAMAYVQQSLASEWNGHGKKSTRSRLLPSNAGDYQRVPTRIRGARRAVVLSRIMAFPFKREADAQKPSSEAASWSIVRRGSTRR